MLTGTAKQFAGFTGLALSMAVCTSAFADIDPLSGIDFVTVGAVGNVPWPGEGLPGDPTPGRGSVGYEYKMGKFEVTTAQWVEFFNAAYDRAPTDRIPFLIPPDFWGAVSTTPNTPGGRRWSVPAGNEMRPTGDISWRMAAIYCNWLHNGKATNREAFLSGAYDVSTFGWMGPLGDIFTDQFTHSPGARYYIPTWDEWLKAAHYDPNKANGDGSLGGWWRYSNGSDTPYVYGPPGVLVGGVPAQANAAWDSFSFPGWNPYAVNLGAYPQVTSPWGLFDVAGGTSEWSESVLIANTGERFRFNDGSSWGGIPNMDLVNGMGAEFPNLPIADFGLRIAAPVPGPASTGLVAVVLLMGGRRKRGGSSWFATFNDSVRWP